MLNIGAGEMILIALVLLIAVGPEQLPGVIRRAGQIVGQIRTMGESLRRDFMTSMDELERAADIKGWAEAEIEAATGDGTDRAGSPEPGPDEPHDSEKPKRIDPFDPETKRISAIRPVEDPVPDPAESKQPPEVAADAEPGPGSGSGSDADESAAPEDGAA